MRTWLIALREKKKFTQNQVAEASGIKRPYYSMIEGGKRDPSVGVAMKIGQVLEFDWTIFFTNECNETTHNKKVVS